MRADLPMAFAMALTAWLRTMTGRMATEKSKSAAIIPAAIRIGFWLYAWESSQDLIDFTFDVTLPERYCP